MESLFQFIEYMCKKYHIDESHGLKHAKGTLARAQNLLKGFDNVSFEEHSIALYAAALHDMCDSKYSDVSISSYEIKDWLLSEGWSNEHANAVISIITTMSYSKLKNANLPNIYPDHRIWQRAYHIARHSDLLEAYIVSRCKLYNEQIHPEKSEEEHWAVVKTLFDNRVFKYVKDGWIFFPHAITIAEELEKEAIRCFDNKSLDWPEPSLDYTDSIFAYE